MSFGVHAEICDFKEVLSPATVMAKLDIGCKVSHFVECQHYTPHVVKKIGATNQ